MTLRGGGYESAELVCDGGGVEAALAVLARGTGPEAARQAQQVDGMRQLAAEALWLMIYDHDSSQRLIQAGGHGAVIRLLREEGPQDAALTGGALRVLGETLYSEARSAEIWGSADLACIVEALDWALRAEPASQRGPLLATVCNIAALWVWRARGAAVDVALPLLGLIPRLLEELANHQDSSDVLQHATRFLLNLAKRSTYWPENVREPTLAALKELCSVSLLNPRPDCPDFMFYLMNALKVVAQLDIEPKPGLCILSAMD